MLDNFMKQLASELEMDEPFALQPEGFYEYLLEEDLSIEIRALRPEGFLLTTKFGPCPQEDQEAFLTSMLEGNLFGRLTHGASLGLDEDGKMMTLSKVVEQKIPYREFKMTLEDFINVVNFWREEAGLLKEEDEEGPLEPQP
jgi:hypothetical protein